MSEWPKALLLSHGYYDLTFVCIFAHIWLLKKIKFSSILFDAPGMWVSLQILSLIQSWYWPFLFVAYQSFTALRWGSLEKEPFCIFLAVHMITWADCFKRSLSRGKTSMAYTKDKLEFWLKQPIIACSCGHFPLCNTWKLVSEQCRNEERSFVLW